MEEAVALAQRLTPPSVLASVECNDFLLTCLREAGLEEDLIEDVAAACELQEPQWTALSLGACQCAPEEAAEKLFLTQDEATALVACAKHHCLKAGAQFGDGSVFQPDAWQPPKPAPTASNGHATASLPNGNSSQVDHPQHSAHRQAPDSNHSQAAAHTRSSIDRSSFIHHSNGEHTSPSDLRRPSLDFPPSSPGPAHRQSLDFPSDASDISDHHECQHHHETHSHLDPTPEESSAPPHARATLASRLNTKKEEASKVEGPALGTLASQLAAKAQAKREQQQALREAQGLPEPAAEPAPAPVSNGTGIGRERPKPVKKTTILSPRNTHSSGGGAAGPITASAWLARAAKTAPGPRSAPSSKPVVSPSSSVSSASGFGVGSSTGPRSIGGMSAPSAPTGACKGSHLKPSVPALSGPATVAAPAGRKGSPVSAGTPSSTKANNAGAGTGAESATLTPLTQTGSLLMSAGGTATGNQLTPNSGVPQGTSTTTIYEAPAGMDTSSTVTAFATPAAAAAVQSPTSHKGRCSSAPPTQLSMPRPLSTSFTLDPHESDASCATSSHISHTASHGSACTSSALQGSTAPAHAASKPSHLRPPAPPAQLSTRKPTLVGGSGEGAQARYTALLNSRSLTLHTSGAPQPPRPLTALTSNANTPSYARPTAAFKAAVTARFGDGEAAQQEANAAMGARSLSGSGRSQSVVYRPSSATLGGRQPSRQQSFGSHSIQEEEDGKKKKSMFAHISASLLRPTKAFLAWTKGKQQEEGDAGQSKNFKARPLPKYMTSTQFRQSVDLGQLHNHGSTRRATFASAGGGGPPSYSHVDHNTASGSTQPGHSPFSTAATTPQHMAAAASSSSARSPSAIPAATSPVTGISSPAKHVAPATLSAPVTPSRIPRPSSASAGGASMSAGGALMASAQTAAAMAASTTGSMSEGGTAACGACASLDMPGSASLGDSLGTISNTCTASLSDQMLVQ